MAGKFELAKSNNNKYFFRLKAGNGEKILGSEMYETKGRSRERHRIRKKRTPRTTHAMSGKTSANGSFFL